MKDTTGNVTSGDGVKPEAAWDIKPGTVVADDPLLGCLVILTRMEHRPFSAEALSAGLPLEDNKFTPELFIRAAQRADISAQVINRPLKAISPLVLPAVLLLKNKQACILVSIKKGGVAEIVQPESGAGVKEIKLKQLHNIYTGYSIFTRPNYRFDSRADKDLPQEKGNWFFKVVCKILPCYVEIIFAALLINLFALATPLFTMNVYDRVVPNNAVHTLMVLALAIFTVYVFDFCMKMLRGYFIDLAGKKADILLQASIYEQLLGVKMDSRPESVGSFANNVSQFDTFRDFITSATMSVVIDLPFVFIFVAAIYMIGGIMALVPICAIPVVLVSGFLIQKPLDQITKESYKYTSQKQAILIESLIGIESIKTSGAEGTLQRKWESLGGLSSKHAIKSKLLNMLASNLTSLVGQISGVVLVIIGVYLIKEGHITMGAIIACNMLNSRCLAPLAQVSSLMTRYHQAMTSFRAVDNMMQMPVDRPAGKTPLHRPTLYGDIEFKDVKFSYPNQEEKALSDVSFHISPGEKVGIIGRIGCGKTTIEKIIMGLYEPEEGSVLFDGTDAKQLDPSTIRRNIGYVPQDIILFYGSIKDNIVMGAPHVDDATILRAASISGVSEFASKHPQGFDMPVGERGGKLSGGQKQSIAIARALLLDPRILVLDEPTNMMDSRSEEMFKLKLSQNMQDKTLVLVTHKGSILSLVNRIILLDSGRVLADGPKDKVLKDLAEGRIRGI